MDPTIGQSGDRVGAVEPAQRSAALADARRRASATALRTAEAAQERRAEQREMTRAIVERAVGANTRLSIARSDAADTYVYRAIDVDSGEVIKEWPPVQFARFLEENGADASLVQDALQGQLFDETA